MCNRNSVDFPQKHSWNRNCASEMTEFRNDSYLTDGSFDVGGRYWLFVSAPHILYQSGEDAGKTASGAQRVITVHLALPLTRKKIVCERHHRRQALSSHFLTFITGFKFSFYNRPYLRGKFCRKIKILPVYRSSWSKCCRDWPIRIARLRCSPCRGLWLFRALRILRLSATSHRRSTKTA